MCEDSGSTGELAARAHGQRKLERRQVNGRGCCVKHEISAARESSDSSGWGILIAISLGFMTIAMTGTSVNLALANLAIELELSERELVWVVNGYLLTFGAFLLLGGGLGDVFGHSRVFLCGIVVFTLASLGCAFVSSGEALTALRVVQGVGSAIASSAALCMITSHFTDVGARTRALGVRAAVGASGSSVGLLFGGTITSSVGWRGMFLVTAVLGACASMMCSRLLWRDGGRALKRDLDVGGAITATASFLLIFYVIVKNEPAEWFSKQSLVLLALAAIALVAFVAIERRVTAPLFPLALLRRRNFVVVNAAAALWSGAVLSWNLVVALYLQRVLQFSPFEVGLMFLPATVCVALLPVCAAPVIARLGFKPPLVFGLALATASLLLFSNASAREAVFPDFILGMLLMGLSMGLVYSPLLSACLEGVPQQMSGAASGVINSSMMMGGAVGMSIVMSIAATRTEELLAAGSTARFALTTGYQVSFIVGAVLVAIATALCGLWVRNAATKP